MDKKKNSSVNNREFAVIAYCFIGLFLCCMGYFVYFQAVKSEDFINNSYNARQENFEKSVIRGKIFSADGETLAETKVDGEGKETRNYPYANVFSHIVGYSVMAIRRKTTGVPALKRGRISIFCVPMRFFWKKRWIK